MRMQSTKNGDDTVDAIQGGGGCGFAQHFYETKGEGRFGGWLERVMVM